MTDHHKLLRSLSRTLGLGFFLILFSSGTLSTAAEEAKSPAQSGENSYPGTDICAVPSITAVRGNLLLLSSGGTDNRSVEPALHFFDLSSRPDAPRLLSTVPLPGCVPQDIAFDGNTLYVAAPPRIFRIDISNPEKPLLTGSSSPAGSCRRNNCIRRQRAFLRRKKTFPADLLPSRIRFFRSIRRSFRIRFFHFRLSAFPSPLRQASLWSQ